MPRRQFHSAAGVLAAALLLAAANPVQAQDVLPETLRGSVLPDDQNTEAAEPGAETTGEAPRANTSNGAGISEQAEQPNAPNAEPNNTTVAEEPSNQTGPLGGLGDILPELQEVGPGQQPQLGLTTEEGHPAETIVAETAAGSVLHDVFEPQAHDLDPYVPIGVRLGTFILYPQTYVGTILTNNVLAEQNPRIPDHAFEVEPDLLLQSNWARNFFSIDVNADKSWYANEPTQDDNDYQVLMKGRLDVTRQTHLGVEAEKSLTQAGRESVSITDLIGQQTNLHEEHVTGSADHTFNRLTLTFSTTAADYNYDDFPTATVPGGLPFQDIRDYDELIETLRASYLMQPGKAVFLESAVNQQDYKQNVFSDGIARDSNGVVMLAGLTLDLPMGLSGEVSAGWGHQQSIKGSVAPIEGPLFNADLIWLPEPMTKLELIGRSEVDVTTLIDSFGTIDRYYELSLQHAFWRYLVLGTYVSYERADFVENPELDQRINEGFTIEYYFNSVASLYGRYQHTNFVSTIPGNGFVDDEVRIGLKLRR